MQYETFCAANSGEGFISFFDTLVDEKKMHVYYIKGGPGSGKSTLLRQLAQKAEEAELIRCSGDPGSLDGIILPDQKAVVIDATAPHSHEPHYPGVGGNLIDLGEGWDPQKLDRDKIMELTDRKKEIYRCCYALLRGAKNLHEGVFSALYAYTSPARIQAAAEKLLRHNGLWENRGRKGTVQRRFLSGITPDGRVTMNETIAALSENIVLLEDRWMIGQRLLSYLDNRLSENGIDHINGYHPLLGKNALQHILVPEYGISFVSRDGVFPLDLPEERIQKKLTIQGMIDRSYLSDHKNKLTFFKRLQREILDLACEKLADARTLHMEIEREYAKGTDFEATRSLKEKLSNNIFTQP